MTALAIFVNCLAKLALVSKFSNFYVYVIILYVSYVDMLKRFEKTRVFHLLGRFVPLTHSLPAYKYV